MVQRFQVVHDLAVDLVEARILDLDKSQKHNSKVQRNLEVDQVEVRTPGVDSSQIPDSSCQHGLEVVQAAVRTRRPSTAGHNGVRAVVLVEADSIDPTWIYGALDFSRYRWRILGNHGTEVATRKQLCRWPRPFAPSS